LSSLEFYPKKQKPPQKGGFCFGGPSHEFANSDIWFATHFHLFCKAFLDLCSLGEGGSVANGEAWTI